MYINTYIDLTGQVFGKLTALRRVGMNKCRETLWLCKCSCGKEATVTIQRLRDGTTKSCGCLRHDGKNDLTGKVFGRLTAIERAGKDHANNTLWRCKCICGNEKIAPANSLNAGRTKSCGCLVKDIDRSKQAKRLTIEHVKKEALKLGKWEIIDDMYVNSAQRLKCVCLKCGVESEKSWDNIKQNKGCRTCNNIDNPQRLGIKEIRASFEKVEYNLSTTVYKNNHQKLEYTCDQGHSHSVTWTNWEYNKRRCPYCAGNAKYTLEEVKFIFKSKALIVLDDVYANNHTPINYECEEGHRHKVTLTDLLHGDGCPYCSPGEVKRDLTTEIVSAELTEIDYELLSEYVNNRTKFLYKCPKGHIHSMTYNRWYAGCRCPECILHGTSLFEQEVKDYISSLNIQFIGNDRTTIFNELTHRYLELDIWFPDLNKAIECNGAYWHQDEDSVRRDKIKIRECIRLEIQLLMVDYNEWNNNKSKCKNRIAKFLSAGLERK
jgi:hypothetical protein